MCSIHGPASASTPVVMIDTANRIVELNLRGMIPLSTHNKREQIALTLDKGRATEGDRAATREMECFLPFAASTIHSCVQ
jgi:hypothetical protein